MVLVNSKSFFENLENDFLSQKFQKCQKFQNPPVSLAVFLHDFPKLAWLLKSNYRLRLRIMFPLMLPMIAAKAKKTNFWLSRLESYLHKVKVRNCAIDRVSKKGDWDCGVEIYDF